MSANVITDYFQAMSFAKTNPGHMVRFEGDLPSKISVVQNIVVVPKGGSVDEYIKKTPGKIVVGSGAGMGNVVTGTEIFNNQPCDRSWAPSGYAKQTFG